MNSRFPLKSLRKFPSRVHVELTTRCNLDCVYCHRAGLHAFTDLPPVIRDLLVNFLVPNCLEIELQGTGESLLYPDIDYILDAAFDAKCKINLITNGLYLTNERFKQLYEMGSQIVVSIDSANPLAYEALRPGASFVTLMSNISYWRTLKRHGLECQYPSTLVANMTLTAQNLYDIDGLLQLLKNLNFDGLFVSVVRRAGVSDTVWDEINLDGRETEISETLTRGFKCAEKLNIFFGSSFISEDNTIDPYLPLCPAPWNHVYISAKGDVYPCCAYQASMGNCVEQPFEEIWNGHNFAELRSVIRQGTFPVECSKCMLPWRHFTRSTPSPKAS